MQRGSLRPKSGLNEEAGRGFFGQGILSPVSLNLFDAEFNLENLGISEDLEPFIVVFKRFQIVFLNLIEFIFC